MLAAIVLGLALSSSPADAGQPRALEPQASCRLIKQTHIPGKIIYSISGHYFSDGRHGSELEIPGCDMGVTPIMEGDAATKIAAFHQAFDRKCGVVSWGDSFSGVFTGRFVRRKQLLFGLQNPVMVNFFVIKSIETKGLDADSVICPK